MTTRLGYVATESIGDVLTKANFDKGPSGLIAYLTTPTDTGSISTVTTWPGMSATLNASSPANRTYKITVGCSSFTTTGTGTSSLSIWDMTGSAQLQGLNFGPNGAGAFGGGMTSVLHQPAAGAQIYALRLATTATTVVGHAGATSPAFLFIEDVSLNF